MYKRIELGLLAVIIPLWILVALVFLRLIPGETYLGVYSLGFVLFLPPILLVDFARRVIAKRKSGREDTETPPSVRAQRP